VRPFVLSFSASRAKALPRPTTLGECIRKARLEKGKTQKALAEAVGVDEMTVVNWEKARELAIRDPAVRHLYNFLGLDYANMVETLTSASPAIERVFGARSTRHGLSML